MTAVANTAFTAAQFNQFVRDNLNETAPAVAVSGASRLIVTNGVNSVVERYPQAASVETSESTGSTTYTDLATPGPSITVSSSARAIVILTSAMGNNTAGSGCFVAYTVSGATAQPVADALSLRFESGTANQDARMSAIFFESALNSGNNTFTAKYKVDGGTGTFVNRRIIVIPL